MVLLSYLHFFKYNNLSAQHLKVCFFIRQSVFVLHMCVTADCVAIMMRRVHCLRLTLSDIELKRYLFRSIKKVKVVP